MEKSSFIHNLSKGIKKKLQSISESPYKRLNLNWFRLKYYKHLPAKQIRTHSLFGKSLYFISPTELLHGFYEIFIEEIYKQQFASKSFVIDCGANIGLSVIYIKQLCPDAQIIAFEPDEKNFELLSKNMHSFGYTDVTLKKEAIWIADTTLQFSNEGSMS